MPKIFVTVGTTSFDEAVTALLEAEVIEILKRLGYEHMTIQIGNSKLNLGDTIQYPDFKVSIYDFKNSIHDDIQEADFVISHAGAGSCIEVLNAGKPLLVIVNEKLMGNHQWELANALEKRGCLHYCTCLNLKQALLKDFASLEPAPKRNSLGFVKYLDKLIGF